MGESDALRELMTEEEQLLRIGIALSSTLGLDELLQMIVGAARGITRADAGSLFIRKGDHLEFAVSQSQSLERKLGAEAMKSRFRPFPVEINTRSMAGYAAATGKTLNIPDAYAIGGGVPYSFDRGYDERSGYRTRSVLVVPMIDQAGGGVGVLQLINRLGPSGDVESFPASSEKLARALASQAAVAVRNAQLTSDLKGAYLDTILRLSMAAEYRDKDTANHIRRMASYSAAISDEMGLGDDAVELILYASPMHDIGKLGIPDAILLKPGKLSPEEFKVMEAHTVIGARILSNADSALLRTSEEIALSHHEKWNGKGYPRGLAGEAIPLRGRICAIADVFDALTSARVYKPAFPIEKAVDIIRKDTGTHFDPQVAEAFLKRMDEVVKIHHRYQDNPDERPAPESEAAAAPAAAIGAQGGGR